MSAADDFASLKHNPTASDVVTIFGRNGLPLKVIDGQLVVPKGITPAMVDVVSKHEAAIVAKLSEKKSTAKEKSNAHLRRPGSDVPLHPGGGPKGVSSSDVSDPISD